MALDPRKAECLGRYGYGTGYVEAIDRVHGEMAARMGARITIEAFCRRCPMMHECSTTSFTSPRTVEQAIRDWDAYQNNKANGRAAYASRARTDEEVARVLAATRRIAG